MYQHVRRHNSLCPWKMGRGPTFGTVRKKRGVCLYLRLVDVLEAGAHLHRGVHGREVELVATDDAEREVRRRPHPAIPSVPRRPRVCIEEKNTRRKRRSAQNQTGERGQRVQQSSARYQTEIGCGGGLPLSLQRQPVVGAARMWFGLVGWVSLLFLTPSRTSQAVSRSALLHRSGYRPENARYISKYSHL